MPHRRATQKPCQPHSRLTDTLPHQRLQRGVHPWPGAGLLHRLNSTQPPPTNRARPPSSLLLAPTPVYHLIVCLHLPLSAKPRQFPPEEGRPAEQRPGLAFSEKIGYHDFHQMDAGGFLAFLRGLSASAVSSAVLTQKRKGRAHGDTPFPGRGGHLPGRGTLGGPRNLATAIRVNARHGQAIAGRDPCPLPRGDTATGERCSRRRSDEGHQQHHHQPGSQEYLVGHLTHLLLDSAPKVSDRLLKAQWTFSTTMLNWC